MSVLLVASPFAVERELAEFSSASAGAGAVASFVGLARDRGTDGEKVERLALEHHPRLTLRSLEEIAAAARAGFEISALRIVHRHGAIVPGEAIVFAAAAAAHRRAALDAVGYVMDRLKTDALFWKREDTARGSRWIEPREDDYAARGRWSE